MVHKLRVKIKNYEIDRINSSVKRNFGETSGSKKPENALLAE
ncbi:hypothetical protein [Ferroplasma sp.]